MKNKGDALAHEKQQMACSSPSENGKLPKLAY